MAGRDPPPFLNTPEDRGAVVAVVSFTSVAVLTLTNIVRVWSRQQAKVALGLDDAMLVAANFSYASNLLAILVMATAKSSVLQLQRRLCGITLTSRYIQIMYRSLAGAIIIWTLFSIFAIAFQCSATSPHIYEPERCANGVVWYPVTIGNAVTDAALAFSFNPIIWKLVAKTRMKVRLMVILGSRIIVCIATAVQIASLSKGLTEPDRTRAMMKPIILQQIVMNLSVITAVVLSLHSLIANLTAGRFGVEVHESTHELSSASYGRSRPPTRASRSVSKAHHCSLAHSSHSQKPRERGSRSSLRPDKANRSNAWAQRETSDWGDSDERSNGSQDNIIKRTVTWQVSTNPAMSHASRGDEEELQVLQSDGELREAREKTFLM
ncbi:hypothetical protein Q7P37_009222 [Cladosporium fusiforme]